MNSDATGPLIDVTRDAYDVRGVVRLTLNRPDAFNALSEALLEELHTQLADIAKSDARVVVIAGAGRAFCAGHDLKEMRAAPSLDYYQALFARCSKVMLAIQRMPQPVIARVHGIATAAGCQLVAMCDLAVAADIARFAVSGVNLGLFCATPSVPLARNVSRKAALEMLLTGDFIDAMAAKQQGLVNRVVPLDILDIEVAALAKSICAKPREAVEAGKSLFYRQLEMGIEAAYQLAGQAMACNMMDDSALEGVQAFIDKRPPDWKHTSGRQAAR
ncbi:enoyl-CoA hydratase [Paraburkholderia diazotrophica]|uniref:Enoyl-CoA hydratase domain-containing protein 3, mitochondrial n=1 Tax=Paraburkholderia diazotrophica TaxID=667676 RepID=A0A1H7AQJ6_9BURK|nr:enoyl-CoA hydratase [Paraburkholderia diazotrophica]SEJ64160.1 Enoyl-CoA hydratase/carnithine racemase [Paraburkholderia diazotrophica]